MGLQGTGQGLCPPVPQLVRLDIPMKGLGCSGQRGPWFLQSTDVLTKSSLGMVTVQDKGILSLITNDRLWDTLLEISEPA